MSALRRETMRLKTLRLITAVLDWVLVVIYILLSIANPRITNIICAVCWAACGVLNTLLYIDTDKDI